MNAYEQLIDMIDTHIYEGIKEFRYLTDVQKERLAGLYLEGQGLDGFDAIANSDYMSNILHHLSRALFQFPGSGDDLTETLKKSTLDYYKESLQIEWNNRLDYRDFQNQFKSANDYSLKGDE